MGSRSRGRSGLGGLGEGRRPEAGRAGGGVDVPGRGREGERRRRRRRVEEAVGSEEGWREGGEGRIEWMGGVGGAEGVREGGVEVLLTGGSVGEALRLRGEALRPVVQQAVVGVCEAPLLVALTLGGRSPHRPPRANLRESVLVRRPLRVDPLGGEGGGGGAEGGAGGGAAGRVEAVGGHGEGERGERLRGRESPPGGNRKEENEEKG